MDEKNGRDDRFLGIPFDWRMLAWERVKARTWKPQDRRLLTPKVFGWGWTINFHEAARRLGLLRRG